MHTARFELARVAPADLESAALDRSATCASINYKPHLTPYLLLTKFLIYSIQIS